MIGNVMIDARSTGKYYHCKCLKLSNFMQKVRTCVMHTKLTTFLICLVIYAIKTPVYLSKYD